LHLLTSIQSLIPRLVLRTNYTQWWYTASTFSTGTVRLHLNSESPYDFADSG